MNPVRAGEAGESLPSLLVALAIGGILSVLLLQTLGNALRYDRKSKKKVDAQLAEINDAFASGAEVDNEIDLTFVEATIRANLQCEDIYCASCNFKSCARFLLEMPKSMGRWQLRATCDIMAGLTIEAGRRVDGQVHWRQLNDSPLCRRFGLARTREINRCLLEREWKKDLDELRTKEDAATPVGLPATKPSLEIAACL